MCYCLICGLMNIGGFPVQRTGKPLPLADPAGGSIIELERTCRSFPRMSAIMSLIPRSVQFLDRNHVVLSMNL